MLLPRSLLLLAALAATGACSKSAHRDSPSDAVLERRMDSIDSRLSNLHDELRGGGPAMSREARSELEHLQRRMRVLRDRLGHLQPGTSGSLTRQQVELKAELEELERGIDAFDQRF